MDTALRWYVLYVNETVAKSESNAGSKDCHCRLTCRRVECGPKKLFG